MYRDSYVNSVGIAILSITIRDERAVGLDVSIAAHFYDFSILLAKRLGKSSYDTTASFTKLALVIFSARTAVPSWDS